MGCLLYDHTEERVAAKKTLEEEGMWSRHTTFCDVRKRGLCSQVVYILSCCNYSYECTWEEGEYFFICGRPCYESEQCNCWTPFCFFCAWICCWYPHCMRFMVGGDYQDCFDRWYSKESVTVETMNVEPPTPEI